MQGQLYDCQELYSYDEIDEAISIIDEERKRITKNLK